MCLSSFFRRPTRVEPLRRRPARNYSGPMVLVQARVEVIPADIDLGLEGREAASRGHSMIVLSCPRLVPGGTSRSRPSSAV